MRNLLPAAYRKKVTVEYRLRVAVVVFSLILIIVVVGIALLTPSYFLSRSKRDSASEQKAFIERSIEFRESDGFIAVGTHGTGVYTTYLDNILGIENPATLIVDMNVNVFPNPASDHTTFAFKLTQKAVVTISIYNSSGRRVAELGNSWLPEGTHQIVYNTSELAGGLYLYSLSTKNGKVTGRLIVN